jgi:peroxiredoxin
MQKIVACLLLLGLAACARVDEPRVGSYRAVLELPGGEAPFRLDVTNEDGKTVLYLINGTERTRVSDVRLQDQEMVARFPGYQNYLRARLYRNRMEGEVVLIKTGGKEQVIPFVARPDQPWLFYKKPSTDNADVSGRWQLTIVENGREIPAVAEFKQSHDQVTGRVTTPSGDHGFLAGQVHGDEVKLATFAGGLVYLYHLHVNENGELEGEYWQGLASHATVHGVRNMDARLPEDERTQVKNDGRFNFAFPDVHGKRVSLSDARFSGKVVIVTIGGTCCPNCHDEAGFLVSFYEQYRDRGVEIVGLMFERHGDFERAANAVRYFIRDLQISYPLLVAGISDNESVSKALPILTGIYGYPTTLFIDRNGNVRKIHIGFSGPATGVHYEAHTRAFVEQVEALLAEAENSAESSAVMERRIDDE